MKGVLKGIIAGIIIIVIGVAVLIAGLALNGWKFKPEFETKTFTADGEVNSLRLTVNAGKLKTEFYDGDKVTIDYPYNEQFTSVINEENGALNYEGMKFKWYSFANCNGFMNIPETVIKIPQSVISLDVTLNVGTASIAAGTYKTVKLNINAGTLNISSMVCDSFDCDVSAGAATVNGITCAGKTKCSVSAGSLNVFQIRCNQIDLDVSAGSTNVTVDDECTQYTIVAERSAGSITGVSNQTGTNPDKRLTVNVSAGSVNVTFSERHD